SCERQHQRQTRADNVKHRAPTDTRQPSNRQQETIQAPRQRQAARNRRVNKPAHVHPSSPSMSDADADAGTDPIHDVTVMRVCHRALHFGREGGRGSLGLLRRTSCPHLPRAAHREYHGSAARW
ncbi:hypothetical protein CCMA1212_001760, partial [Trichoderma ghanense]